MKHCSAIRKDEILPFATTWMDLGSIRLSEISHMPKDKTHNCTYIWDIKDKTTNKENKLIGTDSSRAAVRGQGCGETERDDVGPMRARRRRADFGW